MKVLDTSDVRTVLPPNARGQGPSTLERNSTLSPSVRPIIAPHRELQCKDGCRAWLLMIRRGLRCRLRLA